MRTPSLIALRMIEASVRPGSFAAAAGELHLTAAAVGRQIRLAEEALGQALFARSGRRVAPTEAALRYAERIAGALGELNEATREFVEREARRPLTVTTSLSFARLWLVPRLERFHARHPQVDLRLAATDNVLDLDRGDIDAVVRYGSGRWPGLRSELLLAQRVFPVCAPGLLDPRRPIRQPADLLAYPRLDYLETEGTADSWEGWLAALGVPLERPLDRSAGFNNYDLLLDAAVDGRGLILGVSYFVEAALAQGRLVAPLGAGGLVTGAGHHIVHPRRVRPHAALAAFLDWLREEAGRGAAEAG